MRFYWGGFGSSFGAHGYGGIYTPILRGIGAVGFSGRGTPWIKISGRRLLRGLGRSRYIANSNQPPAAYRVALFMRRLFWLTLIWAVIFHIQMSCPQGSCL